MRRILLSAVMSLAALPAFAADLPSRVTPAPSPIMAAPVYNWTGFYVGANAGYAWGSGDVTVLGNPAVLSALSLAGLPTGVSLDNDGFTIGVQAGYNYQINQFVLGAEADANWVDGSDNRGALGSTGLNYFSSSKVEWLSTIRARAGFAINNVLIYGTGGFAFGEAKSTVTLSLPGSAWTGSESGTRTGWTLGAGVEYAFTRNITARVEYLYYDLGDKTYTTNTVGALQATAKAQFDGNIIRAGVNYKF